MHCRGETTFEAFQPTDTGAIRGLQAFRREFDAILLDQARELGVEIVQPGKALKPLVEGSRVTGIETGNGEMKAAFVIDAAGRGNWLARHLNLEIQTRSPRLIARYAFMEGECPVRDDNPGFFVEKTAWTWTVRVRPGVYSWARLSLDDSEGRDFTPSEFASLTQVGRVQSADVTWRIVPQCAGEGYFLCGDAAAVLDPTSSHGVVKAIMSGAYAGDTIARIIHDGADASEAASVFRQLFATWFEHDIARMKEEHARWFGSPG